MAEPFLSEIRLMGFGFAPRGWAKCDGQTMPINQNQALFSLLGTNYGGNGQTTFGLPDLRTRVPIHGGPAQPLGETGGEQAHSLVNVELPEHTHAVNASPELGDATEPDANVLASASGLYGRPAALTPLDPSSVEDVGGRRAHANMQPFLTLNFCIALQGLFPSQN